MVIENQGSINAILESLSGVDTANAASPADIQFTLTGVTLGDELAAGASKTATVTVKWDEDSVETAAQTKTATIVFNYIQNT